MTYKEKLIMFLKTKDLVIYKYSNLEYTDRKDIYEIENWSEDICFSVYEHIVKYIIGYINSGTDNFYHAQTCPWCVYYFNIKGHKNCSLCKYGKRNGVCSNHSSRYRKLTEAEALVPLNKNKYIEIIDGIENNIGD